MDERQSPTLRQGYAGTAGRFPLKSCQRREGRRMSIAVGLEARGGIVVAADTQLTYGDEKTSQGKFRAIYCSDVDPHSADPSVENAGSVVVAGAGLPDGYLTNASEMLIDVFEEDKSVVGKPLRSKFQQALAEFNDGHIVPYLGLPPTERPCLDFLIAYSRNGTTELLSTDYAVVNEAPFYVVCGIAKAYATALLADWYSVPMLPLPQAVVLASIVVRKAKALSIYIGNATDLVVVANSRFIWLPRDLSDALDDAWKDHGRTLEMMHMRRLLDVPIDESREQQLLAIRETFARLTSQVEFCLGAIMPPARMPQTRRSLEG